MVTEFLPGPAHPPKVTGSGNKVVSMEADLSKPAHPPKTTADQFSSTFACDALTSSGNEEYDLPSNQRKANTDTDSDGKTEIITDITCKFKGKLIAMEVKVDPGSKTNYTPLSNFRHLCPQLCREDGNPKENALEPTLAQFEAYDGGILHSHGWIILPTSDIKEVSSCEIPCGDQGGNQDPDKLCYNNLAGTREGPMSKQDTQGQKASSICF